MDDTQTESRRETAAPGRTAPAPVVRLSAEDISSIASTVAEILRRQGQREDRETTTGAGSPSTAARTDHQRSRAKQVREYLRVRGQPRNVVSTRPEGLASDETAHQEGGRSRPLRDLWIEESCPAAHQNGMRARSCTRIG